MTVDARVAHALTLVEERTDELIGRIVERVLEFYGPGEDGLPVAPDEMAANAAAMVQAALAALRDNRRPTDDELAVATILGERRARQGVSLESVLRALRGGAREALVIVSEEAAATGMAVVETIGLTTALLDWLDEVSVTVAEAHRRIEVSRARNDEQQRSSLLHGLIRATLDPREAAERAAAFGLDPDGELVVVCVRPRDVDQRERLVAALVPRAWSPGLVADVDRDLVAILPAAPVEPLDAPAGIAVSSQLGALPRGYRDAAAAAHACAAAGVDGLKRLDEVVFEAADEHLGALLAARYVEPVRALGAFGEELLATLRVFAASDQNVEAAALELHVHPNTLRHRLARYEQTVGVSLRNVRQLAYVWWALSHDARVGDPPTAPVLRR